jgi:hypothetical protein
LKRPKSADRSKVDIWEGAEGGTPGFPFFAFSLGGPARIRVWGGVDKWWVSNIGKYYTNNNKNVTKG